jgi:bacillithiol biosynthesis cysteine-adding enzyme BshC
MERRIKIEEIISKKNKIYIEYLKKEEKIKEYFKERINLSRRGGIKKELFEVLWRYNKETNAGEKTFHNLEKLKEDKSLVVITGQQPNILTGPLFIIYKTIAILKYASKLANKGKDIVPVFWISSDDVDWEEVNHLFIIDRNKKVKQIDLKSEEKIENIPYGRIKLKELKIDNFLEELEKDLGESIYKAKLINFIKESIDCRDSLTRWFSKILHKLFKNLGLIVVDPHEKEIKDILRPLFEKEIKNPTYSTYLLNRAGEKLKASGYLPKIHKKAHLCNFYLLRGGKRKRLFYINQCFLLDGEEIKKEEILKEESEKFSLNVVLQPLAQSFLLPMVATICGPGEISYYAQLKDIYREFKLVMPYIIPRPSITLIVEEVSEIMERNALLPWELILEKEVIINNIIKKSPFLQNLGKIKEETLSSLDSLKGGIITQNELFSSFKKLNFEISSSFKEFEKKIIKAEKKRRKRLREEIEFLKDFLFPYNLLQERSLNIFYFLNRYGLELIEEFLERISLNYRYHYFLNI